MESHILHLQDYRPFDSITPSGAIAKISSAVVVYGTTVTLQPLTFNSSNNILLLPKSTSTTLRSLPVETYGVLVETISTSF